MDCRKAEQQIFAERDGALAAVERAELADHIAQCRSCRALQHNYAADVAAWRDSSAQVKAPDALLEWHKLRREIRGGAPATSKRRSAVRWVVWPVAAAAALALALFVDSPFRDPATSLLPGNTARIDSPPAPATAADSTVVLVDEKSGWVFVWASDGPTHI